MNYTEVIGIALLLIVMILPYEDFRNYTGVKDHVDSNTRHRHAIRQGVYNGKDYFSKRADSLIQAQFELLAQSIFRIVDPRQPNTVLLQANQEVVVLSESVEGFHTFRSTGKILNETNYQEGTGLGQILVAAAYVQENDLKDGNIGLDLRGHVIKIDGDCTFWDLDNPLSTQQFELSTQLIQALPHPSVGKFKPYNWIGFINEELAKTTGSIFDANLSQNPAFKRELYEGILKIALLPDEFIIRMVEASGAEDRPMINLPSMPSLHLLQDLDAKEFLELKQQVMWSSEDDLRRKFALITLHNYKTQNFDQIDHQALVHIVNSSVRHKTNLFVFLNQRRDLLLQSALNIEEFKSFLMSPEALQLQTDFVEYLKTFRFNERYLIADGLAIDDLVAWRFGLIREALNPPIEIEQIRLEEEKLEAKTPSIQSLFVDCESLLAELDEEIINERDLLKTFVREKSGILTPKLDLVQLQALKTELEETLAIVNSHEVLAVKRVIFKIASKGYIFGESGAREKAQRIEEALAAMPIAERRYAISSSSVNEVKKALASHEQQLIFSGVNLVNSFFASSTYTDLKKEFPSPPKPKQ